MVIMLLAVRQYLYFGTGISLLLLLWFMSRSSLSYEAAILAPPKPSELIPSSPPAPPTHSAGNATLGFQSILALSTGPSWRTRGLFAAANLTGLSIQMPPQPPIHPDLVRIFETMGPEEIQHPAHGASIAWLAHLDIIKYAIQADLDTALIIEDDVDWDVSIRSQMIQIAESVRNLTKIDTFEPAPYGRDWDVLWIGHCGEVWEDNMETVLYEDPTACPLRYYNGWGRTAIEHLPYRHRAVYRSVNPVCSFAYGLSRNGSQKVLKLVGAGQDEAFDISMMHACQAGKLKCISVLPEVVHQYFPNEMFGVKSVVDIGNGEEAGPDDPEFEHVMGSTENILESARCRALWNQKCLKV
ncbi:hypothetical protein BDV23DRAFT_17121 [Aspergillus alliaceus]|uniref:Glycosyltransferase family 25 protein n=1 Tax=Petromyces alliaceus TaxID=209559 RepID=A0A5N7CIW4_PETAA|nr:hypothetical protein BDV23DRAFT_17121 [Aspergillus alliaceus]